jgi:hypothetical protein
LVVGEEQDIKTSIAPRATLLGAGDTRPRSHVIAGRSFGERDTKLVVT